MMKLSKFMISISLLTTSLLACSPAEWHDKEFLTEFASACNPENTEAEKRYCDCQIEKLKAKYPNRSKFVALAEAEADKELKDARKQCVNWDMKIMKDGYMKECNDDGFKLSLCSCQHKSLSQQFPFTEQFTKLSEEEQIEKEKAIAESCLTWEVMGADMIRKLQMDKQTAPIAKCLIEEARTNFPTFEEFAEAEDDGLMQSVISCTTKLKQSEDLAGMESPPPEEE